MPHAIHIGAGPAGIEEMMRRSGLYRTEEIRPVRELFLDSRWTLGGMLRKVMRGTAGRPKKNEERAVPNFKAELHRLNLEKKRAIEAQRIGTLPEPEKAKAYADAAKQDVLPTIELLIDVARLRTVSSIVKAPASLICPCVTSTYPCLNLPQLPVSPPARSGSSF